jgi:maleate isomerase
MYGWRARIGLALPSTNTVNEPEFRRHLPDGVSLHAARMFAERTTPETLAEMAGEIERCGELLATAEVDVAVFGCTSGSLVGGERYDEEIEAKLREAAGVPAVATAAAIKRAFDALDVASLAITTPYVEAVNRREEAFLEAAGFDVVAVHGLGIEENVRIGRNRNAVAVDRADADAVFVSCTDYRTFEVIESLERDLGKPVVTSNQATLWNALRTLGIDGTGVGPGRLFDR